MMPESSGKTPEQIREEIQRAREQIAQSVQQLRREVEATTDWREWVRRRPGPFVAGAFLIGFLLGTRGRD